MDQLFDAADPGKSLIHAGHSRHRYHRRPAQSDWTLRIASGVIVLGRAADLITPETGLQTGDVIHALNTTPITSMDGTARRGSSLKVGDPVVLQVERSDGLSYLSFEME
jgi:S1-C subfamily serine protease